MTDHLERLLTDISLVYHQPGHKTLSCAQDVSDALLARSREARDAPETLVTWGDELVSLLSIPVTVVRDYEPGRWKLVKHDRCEVVPGGDPDGPVSGFRVVHDGCTVIDEEPAPIIAS